MPSVPADAGDAPGVGRQGPADADTPGAAETGRAPAGTPQAAQAEAVVAPGLAPAGTPQAAQAEAVVAPGLAPAEPPARTGAAAARGPAPAGPTAAAEVEASAATPSAASAKTPGAAPATTPRAAAATTPRAAAATTPGAAAATTPGAAPAATPGAASAMAPGAASAAAPRAPAPPLRAELRATLALAAPLALTNVSQVALTLTDTIFLGHLSTEALGAATLGATLFWVAAAALLGLGFGVAAAFARARGAGRPVGATARAAVIAGLLAVPPLWLILWFSGPILRGLGQDPLLADLAQDYLRAMGWGVLPFYGFLVLRGWTAACERPGAALAVTLIAILANALFDWVLIFGLGLGITGAGLASALSNTLMFGGLAWLVARDPVLGDRTAWAGSWAEGLAGLRALLRLSLPVVGSMTLEVAVFGAAAILVGLFGAVAIAAHGIALQVASATFMVPLGVSQAATARVGLAAGAGQRASARRAGSVAIGVSAVFMAASAAGLMLGGGAIAALFLGPGNPGAAETLAQAASLLLLAGLFQLGDGVQVTAAGALRGLADTRVPMWLAALGYWGVGLPVGALLAFPLGLGAEGVWAGLVLGLSVVAVLMTARWLRLSG
jgi:MATE family multidrug resistance protein